MDLLRGNLLYSRYVFFRFQSLHRININFTLFLTIPVISKQVQFILTVIQIHRPIGRNFTPDIHSSENLTAYPLSGWTYSFNQNHCTNRSIILRSGVSNHSNFLNMCRA